MRTSEAINELSTALAKAQGEFTTIEKRKHAKIKTNSGKDYGYAYADISDVLAAVLPVLSKNGLSVIQPTVVIEHAMFVVTRLMHNSGQWIESEYPVCSINGDHQKMGGALTYSRRYALCSMLAVSADEDVDGEGAEAPPTKVESPKAAVSAPKPATKPTLATVKHDPAAALRDKARGIAREGSKAFNNWYHMLSDTEMDHVDAIAEELVDIGNAADAAEVMRAG